MHHLEQWADCPGYEGLYRISDQGRVFNLRRQKFLSGTITRAGYRQVNLTIPRSGKRFHYVHALVLAAFIGPRPSGYVCDHISANRLDNRLCNLEWVTPRENTGRAARAGRLRPNPLRGEQHPLAKLTKAQVQDIRLRAQAGASYAQLGREYRVTKNCIREIVIRKRWKHVD